MLFKKGFNIKENQTQKHELVRILMQTMESLGYEFKTQSFKKRSIFFNRDSAGILSKESGVALENDLTLNFKKDILMGKWEKSLEKLEMMNMSKECFEVVFFMVF